MTKAFFIMSTGRCSTQFIANTIQKIDSSALIEHEAIKYKYDSQSVFRRTNFSEIRENNETLDLKIKEIDNVVKNGRRYIEVGWPAFAWLPHLIEIFNHDFEFIHLVRNPFDTATSILTHEFFCGRNDGYATKCMITDESETAYPELLQDYPSFSPLERALFHWLEVNTFIAEHHGADGFRGIFHFENLFSPDSDALNRLMSTVLGYPVASIKSQPFDRFQRKLLVPLTLEHKGLILELTALSERLGYSDAEIEKLQDLEVLQSKYSDVRLPTANKLQRWFRTTTLT